MKLINKENHTGKANLYANGGSLSDEERKELLAHMDNCEACKQIVQKGFSSQEEVAYFKKQGWEHPIDPMGIGN